MKINFNRAALSEVLGLLTSVVPARTPKPVLRCVRITAAKDQVRICATDLEVGLNCLISQAQVDKAGDVVVPADKLAAVVRESVDDVLVFEAHDSTCEVKGADSHFTIYGQQPELFPPVPLFEGKAELEINLADLQVGVQQCLFATAKESTRYALNGVLWEIKGKKLILVATDGRRLARSIVPLASPPGENIGTAQIIVPAKTMALIEKLGSDDKETVSVKLADSQFILSCGGVVISSILVEGNFPKYEEIIPTDYDKKISLSTDAVSSAVRRAALLTSEESRGIKIAVSKKAIIFSGRAPEAGDAQVEMMLDYKGEPIDIGFNPQFLLEALRVIKTPEFRLELGQADRPGVIKSDPNFLYVLMPINLG